MHAGASFFIGVARKFDGRGPPNIKVLTFLHEKKFKHKLEANCPAPPPTALGYANEFLGASVSYRLIEYGLM